MYVHLTESKEAREFFDQVGISIDTDSAHNAIKMFNLKGDSLTLWAESDYSVAAGIPGIYIDEVEKVEPVTSDRHTYLAIAPLNRAQRHLLLEQFEELETTGNIGDCLLRQTAMSLPGAKSSSVIVLMTMIAMECYRYFANESLN